MARPGKQRLRREVKQGRQQRQASFYGRRHGENSGQGRGGRVTDTIGAVFDVMQHGIERRLDRDRSISVQVLDAIDGADLDLRDLRSVRLHGIEGMGNRRHERIHQYRETRDPDMQALPSCPFSHGREYSKNSCLICAHSFEPKPRCARWRDLNSRRCKLVFNQRFVIPASVCQGRSKHVFRFRQKWQG